MIFIDIDWQFYNLVLGVIITIDLYYLLYLVEG